MLMRVFHRLLDLSYTPASRWLCEELGVESIYSKILNDDVLKIELRDEAGRSIYRTITQELLTKLLMESKNVALAGGTCWFLVSYHDVYDDACQLFHDYLSSQGVVVEQVPFLYEDDCLVLCCSPAQNKKYKDVKGIKVSTEGDLLTVLLPLENSVVRDLLFGRLRRISHE